MLRGIYQGKLAMQALWGKPARTDLTMLTPRNSQTVANNVRISSKFLHDIVKAYFKQSSRKCRPGSCI